MVGIYTRHYFSAIKKNAFESAPEKFSFNLNLRRALGETPSRGDLHLQVCARVPPMAVIAKEKHSGNKDHGPHRPEEREAASCRPEGDSRTRGLSPH